MDSERLMDDLAAVIAAEGVNEQQLAAALDAEEASPAVVFRLLHDALAKERTVGKLVQEPVKQRWREGLFAVAIPRLQSTMDAQVPVKHLLRQMDRGPEVDALNVALTEHRERLVRDLATDSSISWTKPLPAGTGIGFGLDERVIEIPLAIEQLRVNRPGRALDAGAALNLPLVHQLVSGGAVALTHFTQSGAREQAHLDKDRFSYMFGDLRELPYRDHWFDRVLCVSTLEHVGMDNRRYGGPRESSASSYLDAVAEMMRVLAPGGELFLTFPSGPARTSGWFQVFDGNAVRGMTDVLSPATVSLRTFAYDGAWRDVDLIDDGASARKPARGAAPASGDAVLQVTAILAVKPTTP